MSKHTFAFIVLSIASLTGSTGIGFALADQPAAGEKNGLELGNPDEFDTSNAVLVKKFLVAMRRNHGHETGDVFRAFIDPRYLEAHKLTEGKLPITTIPVLGIHSLHVADDHHTVFAVVNTKDNPEQKQAILLRTAVHDGRLYLQPMLGPNAESGSFTPWILLKNL